jgi:hypothetical protein
LERFFVLAGGRRGFYLFTRLERLAVLLSIADVQKSIDVCFQGKTGKYLLALSYSQFDQLGHRPALPGVESLMRL